MNIIRRFAIAAGSLVLAMALAPGAPAHAAAPIKVPTRVEVVTTVVETVVTAADLAPVLTTTARPGEGVIRITTRICGNANNWQNVAASNGIRPPVYLVLLGQRMSVACTGTSVAPAPAQQSAPASSGWVNPLPGYTNGSCNYWEWRGTYNHRGEDWPAPAWTPIRAAASGQATASWGSGKGNSVLITHLNGAATVYMHMVQQGYTGWVNAGQIIGYVGSTGNSYGNHLHFEVQPWGPWNGVTNPVSYLRARGVSVGC